MQVLVTPRLTLRPPLEVDLEPIARAIGDFEVSRWLGQVPYPYMLGDAHHWFENIETGPQDKRWTLHDATSLVGVVSLSRRVREEVKSDHLELGYWLARPCWGRGLMSEAVHAVLAHHFASTDEPVVSGAHEGNAASLAIQRKMGFEKTHEVRLPSKAQGRDVTVQRTRLTAEAFRARFPERAAA